MIIFRNFDQFKKQIYDELERETKKCKNKIKAVDDFSMKSSPRRAYNYTNTTWFSRPTSKNYFSRCNNSRFRGKSAKIMDKNEKEIKEKFENDCK